jgi:hypothetical protein
MVTDISCSDKLAQDLETALDHILRDIYYWGKIFPRAQTKTFDNVYHDDSYKTAATNVAKTIPKSPAQNIVVDVNADESTNLSTSSRESNVNEDEISNMNIDDDHDDQDHVDQLKVTNADSTSIMVTDTISQNDILKFKDDVVNIISNINSLWKHSGSVSKYDRFILPDSYSPIIKEIYQYDRNLSPSARYGVELNAGCGLMSLCYYNYCLNYNMICFEHSELCYKQLLETQLLLGNELPVNNQQIILKSRFYKNNTTAEIACTETVITKLGMNSSYIHFVSFFKLQYSKKDVELIFSYLTTLPLLVHIITDVDKTFVITRSYSRAKQNSKQCYIE